MKKIIFSKLCIEKHTHTYTHIHTYEGTIIIQQKDEQKNFETEMEVEKDIFIDENSFQNEKISDIENDSP